MPVAGFSERMGRWKPELSWKGRPLLTVVAERALAHCGRLLVVTGFRATDVPRLLPEDPRIRLLHNDGFELGMFSSIQTALPEVSADTFFVFLADMPAVPAEVVARLAAPEISTWIRPAYKGRPGHPVRIHRRLVPELLELDRRTGAMRQVLHRYEGGILETDEPGVYVDLDRPEDFARLGEAGAGP
ncbi:MAG: NTP transferase domain-containing protein [Spirochaetaceae bacterium]